MGSGSIKASSRCYNPHNGHDASETTVHRRGYVCLQIATDSRKLLSSDLPTLTLLHQTPVSGLAIFRGEIVQMFAAVVLGGGAGAMAGAVTNAMAGITAGSMPIIAQLQSAFSSAADKQKKTKKGPTLAQDNEINVFLASVERRAFKHAAYAVRDDDAAMDIVQDSMMKLTESYSDKPANELPMLFKIGRAHV